MAEKLHKDPKPTLRMTLQGPKQRRIAEVILRHRHYDDDTYDFNGVYEELKDVPKGKINAVAILLKQNKWELPPLGKPPEQVGGPIHLEGKTFDARPSLNLLEYHLALMREHVRQLEGAIADRDALMREKVRQLARVLMPSPDAEPPEDLFPPEVLEEAEDFEKMFPVETRPEAKAKPTTKKGRPKKAAPPPTQPTAASIVTTAPPVLEPPPEAPTEAKPAPVTPTDKPKWATLGFASEKEQGDMRLKLYDMLAKHIFANDLPPEQGPINSARGWLREHGCEFPEDDRNPTRNVTKPQLEGLILEAQKLLDLTTL